MNEKIKEICAQTKAGKLTLDAFYDKLRAVADDEKTDDDTACLLEDILMEIEMEHDGSGSRNQLQKLMNEFSDRILKNI